jgi:uncharacterized protein YdeI (YjbR/CyaY-like superfamily)
MQPETETFYPKNRHEWRQWLQEHHVDKASVWVVMYKKQSGKPSILWTDAVDEALCFGWIDSLKKSVDSESSIQFFSKRKSKSGWSKINKDKIIRLIEDGQMTAAGLATIETAKQNGTWTMLDTVEELLIPEDLEKAFKNHPGADEYFLSLSKSIRKMMLQWLVLAKRPETRQNRINEIAELAGKKMKPKQF